MKTKIYLNIILANNRCRCGTWRLLLRDAHTLRVFGKRFLRTIFGPIKEETKGTIKLHYQVHHDLQC
jgi:hypothetical protein